MDDILQAVCWGLVVFAFLSKLEDISSKLSDIRTLLRRK